jgi:hypothetical protein
LQRNQAGLNATDDELLGFARRIVLEDLSTQELETWLAAHLDTNVALKETEERSNRGDLREK